jgi:hypothetical protein
MDRSLGCRSGGIEVRVTERGLPIALKLEHRALSRAPTQLAHEILSLCQLSALRAQVARRRDLAARGYSPGDDEDERPRQPAGETATSCRTRPGGPRNSTNSGRPSGGHRSKLTERNEGNVDAICRGPATFRPPVVTHELLARSSTSTLTKLRAAVYLRDPPCQPTFT